MPFTDTIDFFPTQIGMYKLFQVKTEPESRLSSDSSPSRVSSRATRVGLESSRCDLNGSISIGASPY